MKETKQSQIPFKLRNIRFFFFLFEPFTYSFRFPFVNKFARKIVSYELEYILNIEIFLALFTLKEIL